MVGILKKLFKKEKITKKYKDGDIYIGEMKNDEHHGQGTYTWTDGSKYVGEYKDDEHHGRGTFTWASGEFAGDKYVGEYKDGKRNGQGTYTMAEGDEYVGEYKDDEKHGQGTVTFADGEKYVGEWKDDKRNGQGTETYASGDKYVGEWKDNKRHGQGTYTFADGDKYVGEWEGDEQCEGTITSADGKVEKITKTIKRNELAIFEELRLKPPTSLSNKAPKKSDLKKIDIFKSYNLKLKKHTYWQKNPTGRIVQVNQYGELVFSSNDEYQRNTPKKSLLKKYKTDVRFHRDEYIEDYVTWWTEDKNGGLVQVNIKKGDVGIKFKIKSWLRNQAIDVVGLEIRNMKKKAYEYSKEELEDMVKKEEDKIINKQGWKWIRRIAMVSLGIGFIPGI